MKNELLENIEKLHTTPMQNSYVKEKTGTLESMIVSLQ